MQEMKGGLFTQLPDVLLTTCDLPDEALMLFVRLYAQSKFTYILHSSVRKIANALGLKRDKVHRNLKVLVGAGLLTIEEMEGVHLCIYTLNVDALWQLNAAYRKRGEVERWTNLQTALESVRETGQDEAKIGQSITIETRHTDRQTGQIVQKPDTASDKPDETVRPSEHKVTPKEVIDSPKITLDKESSCTASTLSSDQQKWFDEVYCQSLIANAGRTLTSTLKNHVIKLSTVASTVETLNDLYIYTRTFIESQSYLKDKTVKAGNLVNCIDGWQQEKRLEAAAMKLVEEMEQLKASQDDAQPEQAVEPSRPSAPYFITATIRKASCDRSERERVGENIEYTVQMYQASGLPQLDFRGILAQAERETAGPGMDSFFERLARLARVSISV